MWIGIMRGLGVAAFFAITLLVMIPAYVPRPAFIPGFAPPPDMWPRTVCIIGITLGLILALMAWLSRVARVVPDPEKQAAGDAGPALLLGRFVLAVVALAAFTALVPVAGFVPATVLLTAVAIALAGERRRWVWALVITVALPVGLAFFFHAALGTQFPQGQLLSLPGL